LGGWPSVFIRYMYGAGLIGARVVQGRGVSTAKKRQEDHLTLGGWPSTWWLEFRKYLQGQEK